MNKIPLIIKREYLTRVRKKSFIIMTIIGPLLIGGMMIVPIWLSQVEQQVQFIKVIDDSWIFVNNNFQETETIKFDYSSDNIEQAKAEFHSKEHTAILYIPKTIMAAPKGIQLYYKQQPGITTIRYIEQAIEKEIESGKLAASGIDVKILNAIKTNVRINTIGLDKTGAEEKSYTELSMIVGMIAGVLIYVFIFLYGAQVMRGVIEEKTSRIVEIIISSVKPFQLMVGKIVGVAMVGLTQFLLWIVFTSIIISAVQAVFLPAQFSTKQLEQTLSSMPDQAALSESASLEKNESIKELMAALDSINIYVMIGAFLFYFLGGYLLYGALFAAIGAAVDNDTDTQQFILPITIPLILAIVMLQFIIINPEGPVAFWFSIIPLTSPVVMMVRIPFGVPYWEVALSIILLIIGFVAAAWLAAKIYRTGILMYGKKVTYRELWKWLFY